MKMLKGKLIALDLETTGLKPYRGDRAFCLGYYTDRGEKGYRPMDDKTRAWLKAHFDDPKRTFIFHKAQFDMEMLMFEGIDPFTMKARFDCTLTMSKVLFSTSQSHDLRTLTIKHLKRDPKDKDDIQKWIKDNKWSFTREHGRPPGFNDAPEEMVKRRVQWDAESTFKLYDRFIPHVRKICPDLYETERTLILVCIDMQRHGLLIDISKAEQLKKKASEELRRIQQDIDKLVGCPFTITRKKKKRGEYVEVEEVLNHINPGSSAIHLPAAFERVGIPLKYKTKPKKNRKTGNKSGGGRWAFDEYAMVRYVSKPLAMVIKTSSEEGWPVKKYYAEIKKVMKKHKLHKREFLPPLILKYRELSKMISTYYKHLIEDCCDVRQTPTRKVGVLHARFNPSEAMTGRFSISEPSLQNVPRTMGPRQCIIPRLGRRNWHSDYEQVEMKMFVHFAKDKKMAAAIADDIHLKVASEIYQLPKEKVTSEQRKRAKGTNFGIIYGAGAATIAETLTKKGLPTSTMEGKLIVAQYHRRFPSVRRTTQALASQLRRLGYITNPFGRRYHIPVKFAYKALNYMCQGTSADLMKLAMVKIWKWLRKHGMRSKIIMTIHDEIVIECVRVEEKIVMPMVRKMMEDLKSFFVPITVDMKVVTHRWSHKIDQKKLGTAY